MLIQLVPLLSRTMRKSSISWLFDVIFMGRRLTEMSLGHMRSPRPVCAAARRVKIFTIYENSPISLTMSLYCVGEQQRPDQTARMRRLVWIFAVRIYSKVPFLSYRPSYILYVYNSKLPGYSEYCFSICALIESNFYYVETESNALCLCAIFFLHIKTAS